MNPATPRRPLLAAALLVAVTILVYLPAARAGFVWDDVDFLRENPLIKEAGGLRSVWFSTLPTDYFPLTSTVLWFEWRIWGDHPLGYHVVNVLLHVAAALLLWRVLRRLIPQGGTGAWLAGVLFAVHPVAVASAAWITELKNTLSLPLFLAALLLYLRFDETEEHRSEICNRLYLSSLFLFLLALLAKSSVVMLPVILLLCAWWRRGKISRKDLLRALPFFALSLALGLVTIWFQQHKAIQVLTVRPEGLASRVAASGWIVWFYLYKVLFPAGLCAIYPRWNVAGSNPMAFLPLILLLGGVALLWTRRKNWGRAPLFAAGYFLITLLPVLGFVNMLFMGLSLVADHLQYLAMIGVIAFAAGLLARAASWRGGVLPAVACAALLGTLTWQRVSLYRDPETFWKDNLRSNASAPVWNALATEYLEMAKPEKAIPCFNRAFELGLRFPVAYFNYASACAHLGRSAEAIRGYSEAIAIKPDFFQAYNNRGRLYADSNHLREAIADYEKAISLKPDYAEAFYNLGNAFSDDNNLAEAVRDYDQAIALRPAYREAYNNRAVVYYQVKQYDQALADVKKYESLGGRPNPEFLQELTHAAGSAGK